MDGTLKDLTSAIVRHDRPAVIRLADELRSDVAEHLRGRILYGQARRGPYIEVPKSADETRTLAVHVVAGTPDEVGQEIHSPVGSPLTTRVTLVVVLAGPSALSDDVLPGRVDGAEAMLVGPIGGRDEWQLRDGQGRLRVTTTLRNGLDRLRAGTPAEPAVVTAEPARPATVAEEPAGTLSNFLLVADEWESRHGGISTFNREFAVALRIAGADVRVLVPEATPAELTDAHEAKVTLVPSAPIPGLAGKDLLLTKPALGEFRPDVIVGHGRLLGPYAFALQRDFFPGAHRLHIVHTDAESLEVAKEWPGDEPRMLIAGERTETEIELAGTADLVAGVGPWLSDAIEDDLRGQPKARRPPVFRLTPGLRAPGRDDEDEESAPIPPAQREVLLIGRAEDVRSKGLDIAVRAVEKAIDKLAHEDGYRPTLIIRGVRPGDAAAVKERLAGLSARGFQPVLREYSARERTLWEDLQKARVVIMPSRHEGFGLAAYEAIAAAVPVLITAQSGLAGLLRDLGIKDGERKQRREILSMDGTDEQIYQRWGDALAEVLLDPAGAFTRAKDLRTQLNAKVSWASTISDLFGMLRRTSR